MGHHDLRHDKECQNCGYTVDKAYCSQCGQHNTETRQSFAHLATHTIEDITHYDGKFWLTIKYLLFRPGRLTIEYLQGHRMRYVPPVKLYIFISFICFFIMALIAPEEKEHSEAHKTESIAEEKSEDKSVTYNKVTVYSTKELDSLQNSLPEVKKMNFYRYNLNKVLLKVGHNEISGRDFYIGASHTFPKVLFIYMPIFAFWLWLLHGKKRWYFFDHGIFTLHYFSFLLILITINLILSWIEDVTGYTLFIDIVKGIFGFTTLIYSFFYFFRSHRLFYRETRAISRLKSFILFMINFVLITILLITTLFYIILNSH